MTFKKQPNQTQHRKGRLDWNLCACDCPACADGYAHCKREDYGCFAHTTEEKFNEYIKSRDEEDEDEQATT